MQKMIKKPNQTAELLKKKPWKSRFDALGDRMKLLERMEGDRILMPGLPIMVRLDGKGFSKFTRGMSRPFHAPMTRAMIETARYLVEQTHADFAYTQSDEITLGFLPPADPKDSLYRSRVQKLTSIFASMATAKFNFEVATHMPEYFKRHPAFDARVFNMPTLADMADCVLFRALDCAKNSITMAASAFYTHKELLGQSSAEKHEMLYAKGVFWADYPDSFKNGTYLRRETVEVSLTPEQIEKIPSQHRSAVSSKRRKVVEVLMPPFARIANPVEVLFSQATPVLRTSTVDDTP